MASLASNADPRLLKLQRYRQDLMAYGPDCLKVKTKEVGPLRPLVFNKAQRYIHSKLEEQRRAISMVRAIILKGRQQGSSTYVGARYYHRSSLNRGTNVFILTHEATATDNLFAMVDRYHANSPLRPIVGRANAKELVFPKLDSGYAVGTAGQKAVGRSKTIHLLHGSEVAFWPNATDHFAGVVQTVPNAPGTEIILESTANGVTGEFYEKWQQAEAGIGDYIAIFVPWFWSDEYYRIPPENFELSHETDTAEDISEVEYASLHKLSDGQIYWRRQKIAEIGKTKFMQEYPATADEAFQTTGHDSFIKPLYVLRARKSNLEGLGPLCVGVDPSRYGDDKFAISWRRGRRFEKYEAHSKLGTLEAVTRIKKIIDEDGPALVAIDAGGGGDRIYDILCSYGPQYEEVLHLVNFGGAPEQGDILDDDGNKRPGYRNRRAEIWGHSRDWLMQEGGADIPDEGVLQSQACGPGYRHDIASQKLQLESKDAMRKRQVPSPDVWDSFALTFAKPVYEESALKQDKREKPKKNRRFAGSAGWMGR